MPPHRPHDRHDLDLEVGVAGGERAGDGEAAGCVDAGADVGVRVDDDEAAVGMVAAVERQAVAVHVVETVPEREDKCRLSAPDLLNKNPRIIKFKYLNSSSH